ncbi:Hsp70 family protein [Dactylosporangium sp. AC04546]|uniref:Hsp70 family protein n=1 Tax=Dactylosporangium sp. AC04546 TaxID=2862460 RepID=UPI001EDF33BC|nr:Hsp70 family protein [Dactylosporangium sp. AC04546]WVK79613.1 Hsp70 family protein [Dactylosporangium sp. AC04546]
MDSGHYGGCGGRPGARQLLWRGVRAAKEQLSRHATAEVHVPFVNTDLHLTREGVEKVALPHLERTTALTLAVLRSAGVPREEIAGIFLVGGARDLRPLRRRVGVRDDVGRRVGHR